MKERNIELTENKYAGERIFLIGNGPSLSEVPLDQLESEYSIGVNKIYKRFNNCVWRPDFYILVHTPDSFLQWNDKNRALRKINKMSRTGTICLLYSGLRDLVDKHENIYFLKSSPLDNTLISKYNLNSIRKLDNELLYEFWSDDIRKLVYAYHSTYIMYQVCSYLGFDEIILIGHDLGFEYKNPHMIFDNGLDPFLFDDGKRKYIYKSIAEKNLFTSLINAITFKLVSNINLVGKYASNTTDSTHFSENYWNRGRLIKDNRKLEKQILKGHAIAKKVCSDKNIKIYNGTIGGELEMFPRVDIGAIIDSPVGGDYHKNI